MGKGYHYWGSLESPLISVYSWTNQTKELNLNSKKTPCVELFGIPFFFLGCMYIMYGIFNYTYPKKIKEFHIIRYNYTHTLIPRSYQEPLFRLRDAKKHCMTHHNLGGHIQSYFDQTTVIFVGLQLEVVYPAIKVNELSVNTNPCWWFQPISKILAKLYRFPGYG